MRRSWPPGAASSTALRSGLSWRNNGRSRASVVVCLPAHEGATATHFQSLQAFQNRPPDSFPAEMAGLSVAPRSHRLIRTASKPACSSIVVRPASAFLQASLSKVLRPGHPVAPRRFSPKHSRSRLTTREDLILFLGSGLALLSELSHSSVCRQSAMCHGAPADFPQSGLRRRPRASYFSEKKNQQPMSQTPVRAAA